MNGYMNASVSARIVNPSGRNPSTFLPDGPPTALSVALNAACESHEPLLRVFVRCYDLTPTAYRRRAGCLADALHHSARVRGDHERRAKR